MKHLAKRQQRKNAAVKQVLFKIYLAIVAISALIVGGYLLWCLLVPAPTVGEAVTTLPTVDGTTTAPTVSDAVEPEDESLPVLERRDGVYNILLIGCDDGNGNADTIMIANYDTTDSTCNLVSVPRDTIIARSWSTFPKLNAAYGAGGATLVSQELSYTLGIPIDYYVTVDLTAFEDLVNELGGLDYYVPEDMYHDDEAGFIIDLQEGYQHLDGYQTLQLVRYRGYVNADIGRTYVQQDVLKELAKKALSWNSLTSVNAFIGIFNEKVDTSLSLADMLYLAQSAIYVDISSGITTQTLEGRGDGVKNDQTWCYELDADSVLQVVNDCLNPYTTDLDMRYLNIEKADSYLQ